ncbi:MAG: 1-(5-phosphoribosyl)-5-[(5-phosphoribosylamino)methylideneamino]imidazole-4-carboxamide isomerase [Clostridia bacterium]|nr:1-(5-phosphoribosyl)-5-[(5-phosphoribosylamino)methylideneamino]imidazole-4-carboxamide isomerase [Clostridia bacterium]
MAMALHWQSLGAEYLHLVDLDGAFSGQQVNLAIIQKVVAALKIPVETGGGIRDLAKAEKLLEAGVSRVIFGTAAVKNPDLIEEACQKFGSERVVLGLDARDGRVAVEGWGEVAARPALDLAGEMRQRGVKRVIFTDISRDGTLKGPNLTAIREMAEKSGLKVIASGGVSELEDIRQIKALENLGVEGVITGKALYAGTLKLEEALAVASK